MPNHRGITRNSEERFKILTERPERFSFSPRRSVWQATQLQKLTELVCSAGNGESYGDQQINPSKRSVRHLSFHFQPLSTKICGCFGEILKTWVSSSNQASYWLLFVHENFPMQSSLEITPDLWYTMHRCSHLMLLG